MTGWSVVYLPLLCLGAALLELDALHVGQWLLSRPLVLGPVLGWISGVPGEGVSMGLLMELVTLDDLPVGSAVPLNAGVAVAGSVLLVASPQAVHPAVAFPAGLVLGSIFGNIEGVIRMKRSGLTRLAHEALAVGNPVPFARIVFLGAGTHALATAVFLYGGVLLLGPVLAWIWVQSPEFVRQGTKLAFTAAQCLGWAAVLFLLRPK